jgi:hypothetical protein
LLAGNLLVPDRLATAVSSLHLVVTEAAPNANMRWPIFDSEMVSSGNVIWFCIFWQTVD